MKLHPSPWDFKGIPSEIGSSLGRTQRAPKTPPTPLTFTTKPVHPLRNKEVQGAKKAQRGSMR